MVRNSVDGNWYEKDGGGNWRIVDHKLGTVPVNKGDLYKDKNAANVADLMSQYNQP